MDTLADVALVSRSCPYLLTYKTDAGPDNVGSLVSVPFRGGPALGVMVRVGVPERQRCDRLKRIHGMVWPAYIPHHLCRMLAFFHEELGASLGALISNIPMPHEVVSFADASCANIIDLAPIVRNDAALPNDGWRSLRDIPYRERSLWRQKLKNGGLSLRIRVMYARHTVFDDERQGGAEIRSSSIDDVVTSRAASPYIVYGWRGYAAVHTIVNSVARHDGMALVVFPDIWSAWRAREAISSCMRGVNIVLWHTDMHAEERRKAWIEMMSGSCHAVFGTTVALWCPVAWRAVMIYDESHPAYTHIHDRHIQMHDVALSMSKLGGMPVLFHTFAPSAPLWWSASRGHVQVIKAPDLHHVVAASAPRIIVHDMRRLNDANGRDMVMAPRLIADVSMAMMRRERAVLLCMHGNDDIGVQGLSCPSCGTSPSCPRCAHAIGYSFHEGIARCASCGWSAPWPMGCPKCNHASLYPCPAPQDRLARAVRALIGNGAVLRLGRLTTKSGPACIAWMRSMSARSGICCICHPSWSSHLDVLHPSVVGVINADYGLRQHDDAATAGRVFSSLSRTVWSLYRPPSERPVDIHWQVEYPRHYAVAAASQMDLAYFFRLDDQQRQREQAPPFATHISASWIARGRNAEIAIHHAWQNIEQQAAEMGWRSKAAMQRVLLGSDPETCHMTGVLYKPGNDRSWRAIIGLLSHISPRPHIAVHPSIVWLSGADA